MDYRIDATYISAEQDGNLVILGFADNPVKPDRCLIISMTAVPDEQDIRLGLDGVHLETGGQSTGCYKAVLSMTVNKRGLVIQLSDTGKASLGIDGDIVIIADTSASSFSEALHLLETNARNEFEIMRHPAD